MTLGLHRPIPGGSEYHIEYDGPKQKEIITIYLPPVGYTIDRMPNQETGVLSYQLIKCEILGENLPIEKQKWIRPEIPREWKKWREEEIRQHKRGNREYVNPEAEKFRAQEWTRRVNGCWQAIGNRNGKPTEYVYIPPGAYFYFAWWKPDFGYPRFRLVYLKTWLSLQYAEDHESLRGITLSTHRRHGKTSIAACWTYDRPSMMEFGYGAMQGQAGKKALLFFEMHLMQTFRRLIDFFIPKYDARASQKSQLVFGDPAPQSNKKREELIDGPDDGIEPLGGRIVCVSSSETSMDGTKQHRIWLDEPGKWEKTDVEATLGVYVPCTSDELLNKIGLIFMPSTVEELEKGGQEFISVFEDSMPSIMRLNENGSTGTELLAVFISALEGIVFEEYGRSVVHDPAPGEILLNESGKQIIYGAATIIARRRASKKDEKNRIREVRKYPTSWFEAKMSATFKCQFNAEIIIKRLGDLMAMPRMPFIRGNFSWVGDVDGDVEFVRDDISGRFQVAWLPDMDGPVIEGKSKLINNVGFEWGEDIHGQKIKLWHPKNDRLFASGCDPISYKARGIDPRLSNGGAHIFRKYDASVDQGKQKEDWVSHNFVVQYLFRPDEFEMFGEDMIQMVRYWGCSINAEDNVQALRQHFDKRGYGAFIMYRRDFTEKAVMGNGDLDRPVRSNEEVINNYTRIINTHINRHGMRIPFPEILNQALQFDPNSTQKYDCIVSVGYTLMAAEVKNQTEDEGKDEIELDSMFGLYDQSGTRSVAI